LAATTPTSGEEIKIKPRGIPSLTIVCLLTKTLSATDPKEVLPQDKEGGSQRGFTVLTGMTGEAFAEEPLTRLR